MHGWFCPIHLDGNLIILTITRLYCEIGSYTLHQEKSHSLPLCVKGPLNTDFLYVHIHTAYEIIFLSCLVLLTRRAVDKPLNSMRQLPSKWELFGKSHLRLQINGLCVDRNLSWDFLLLKHCYEMKNIDHKLLDDNGNDS